MMFIRCLVTFPFSRMLNIGYFPSYRSMVDQSVRFTLIYSLMVFLIIIGDVSTSSSPFSVVKDLDGW